jgi:hypothetical protein
MAFGDSDLPTFFADFGVDLVFNGVTVKALEDDSQERDGASAPFADVEHNVTRVEIPYNSFSPMPKRGQSVTLAGVSKKVRDTGKVRDGGIVDVYLVTP